MNEAQGDRIIELLEELINEQRLLRQILTEPAPEIAPPPCTHPIELRTDQNPGARFWKCRECGYVYDSERKD